MRPGWSRGNDMGSSQEGVRRGMHRLGLTVKEKMAGEKRGKDRGKERGQGKNSILPNSF